MASFAALGWNRDAPAVRPSTLTGGLFVNFRPTWDGTSDEKANTNVRTNNQSDDEAGAAARHDPLTDLAILRNVDAVLSTGVINADLTGLRCKLQPVTEAEFVTYGVERGWVYDEMIELGGLDADGPWMRYAQTFATLLAKKFANGIDPSKEFRPDWVATSAAALSEAGERFARPEWTELGHEIALQLCRTSADPTTGFFPGHAKLAASGPATVTEALVKVGSQAQLVDGLLTVYDATQDEKILEAVRKNLTSLQSPAIGIADSVHGGWFYGVDVDGRNVRNNYKETRQAWLVNLFRHAAKVGLVAPSVTAGMTDLVREQMYQPDSRGYVYRVRPDWSPYTSTTNGQRFDENWVSSEATGIAVQALLGPLS